MAGILEFGNLVLCRYSNWKHDQVPLIFVLYSDARLTHGLNSHYLSAAEAEQLRKLLSYVPANQTQYVYEFIKGRFNSVLRAYRKYKTPLIFEIKKWKAIELKDPDVQKTVGEFFKAGTKYQAVLKKQFATPASKPVGISSAEQAMLGRLRQVLTRLKQREKK
jgi:hypothetical protein